MDEQDRAKFAELVTEALGFYRQDVTDFQLDVWWQSLKAFEYAEVERAFSIHIQNPDRGQFPPRPADITRLLRGGAGDRALQAWSRVEKAIRHVGPYRSVIFDDPIIHRVIDEMGGWIRLCEVNTDKDLEFRGQEFRTRFQGYAVRRPQDWPPQLPGYAEADARARSLEPPEPLVLGDAQRALAVHQRGQERIGAPQTLGAVQRQLGQLTGGANKRAGPDGNGTGSATHRLTAATTTGGGSNGREAHPTGKGSKNP